MGIHHHSPPPHPPSTTVKTTSTAADDPLPSYNQPPNPTTGPSPSKPITNALIKPPRRSKKRAPDDPSSSASSSSSHPYPYPYTSSNHSHSQSQSHSSQLRGIRISNKRPRNPKLVSRRSSSEVDAIAFPLGMSIAAVFAQVLEQKDTTPEHTSVEYLSMMCTSAVRESLTNVFGDKFDAFATNFERSFGSTLSTIRLIRSSNVDLGGNQYCNVNGSNCPSNLTPVITSIEEEYSSRTSHGGEGCRESVKPTFEAVEDMEADDDMKKESTESINRELSVLHLGSLQLSRPEQRYSDRHSMLSTIEKSVVEQSRANELKSLEISLIMKKLQLKETQLALNSDSNFLERCKLSLGISRTSFKAEKFKNQLEETKHGELLRTCADVLVADLIIMAFCLCYGVYVFSYENVRQFTTACSHPEEPKSWWRPMASINSGWQALSCQVQVYSRMFFAVSIFLAIGFVLIQRAGIARQVMPITFLILLLGGICGTLGKFCVDTLGGDGYLWLMYWEIMCAVHFFANVCTWLLYYILHGSVQVCPGTRCRSMFPFWARQGLFYLFLLLVPVCCGLLPFASPSTWWEEHFSKLIKNYMLEAYEETNGLH